MALFNRSSDSLTVQDVQPYVEELNALKDRVTALEELARLHLGQSASPARPVVTPSPSYDRSGIPAAARGERTGVDYGAVAFGLSEIKRRVAQIVSGTSLADEYAGTVQYFADVFAKSDPSFNADEFKRAAGA